MGAFLLGQGHQRAVRRGARGETRRLELHECEQAPDLGLVRRQAGEDAAQPLRLGAQRRADQVIAPGSSVALIEDQVDDLEHRDEAGRPLRAAWHLERQPRLAERPLRPDDALGDRRLARQKGAGDLVGGQPADETKGQGNPRLARQHRMAGSEDEAQ